MIKRVASQPQVPPAKAAENAAIKARAQLENVDLIGKMSKEISPSVDGFLRSLTKEETKSLLNRVHVKRVEGSVDVEIAALKGVFNNKPNKAQFKALKHTVTSAAAPAA